MRIFFRKSRFSFGILLALLAISISGVFLTMHNQLTEAQTKTPLLAILFTIASISICIILFQIFSSIFSNLQRNLLQLEDLKKSIQESRKQNDIEETLIEKEEILNLKEEEVQSYFPQEAFENEEKFMEKLLLNISKKNDIVQAIAFKKDKKTEVFSILASYAYFSESKPPTFTVGETLPGQVAKNKVTLNLKEVPENYINIVSGLGKGTPNNLLIVPILANDNECIGIIEFASFKSFTDQKAKLFENIGLMINEYLINIGNISKK